MTPFRVILLVASWCLFGSATMAAVGMFAPGQERYGLIACIAGLLVAAAWRWDDGSFALLAPAAAAALGSVVGLLLLAHGGGAGGFSMFRFHLELPPLSAFTVVVSVAICSTLCGWVIFRRGHPWLAVALAGEALLLRADISRPVENAVPLFLAFALVLVALTYAPSWTAVRAALPAIVIGAVLIGLSWRAPTVSGSWAQAFTDPLQSLAIPRNRELPSTLSLVGPFQPSGRVVMTITSDRPLLHPYWRMAVFDGYRGDEWVSTSSRGIDVAPGVPTSPAAALALTHLSSSAAITHTVVRVSEATDTLVAPGSPLAASVPARVQSAATANDVTRIRADSLLAPGTVYRVSSLVPEDGHIPGGPSDPRYQDVSGIDPRIGHLAAAVSGRSADPLQRLLALQRYLRDSGRFVYDAGAGSPVHGDAASDFLFHTRRGYCNQFATAFVLMARSLGIPARLVSGYASTGVGPTYVVKDEDAHSWAEVNLGGDSWLVFDPTPGSGTARLPAPPRVASVPKPLQGPGGGVRSPQGRFGQLPGPSTSPPSAREEVGSSAATHRGVILLAALVGLVIALVCVWYARRPRTVPDVYRRLIASRSWPGGPIGADETPDEFLGRVAPLQPDAELIVRLYVLCTYAGRSPSQSDVRDARRSWRRLRRVLVRERILRDARTVIPGLRVAGRPRRFDPQPRQ